MAGLLPLFAGLGFSGTSIVCSRVYRGDGFAGPIDYDHAVWDTYPDGIPEADIGPISPGERVWVGVRNYDPVTGYEERNQDVRVLLEVQDDGSAVFARAPSPTGVSALARPGGLVEVSWTFYPRPGAANPDSFDVFVNPGEIDWDLAPLASVPFVSGRVVYTALVGPLPDGLASAGARSMLGVMPDAGAPVATVQVRASGPLPVENLTGVLIGDES